MVGMVWRVADLVPRAENGFLADRPRSCLAESVYESCTDGGRDMRLMRCKRL